MCGANAGAGLHGRHAINGHGNVDDDAIAFLDADGFEAVGNLAGFSQQFAVGNACNFTAVGFKNEGGFIAQTFFHIAV